MHFKFVILESCSLSWLLLFCSFGNDADAVANVLKNENKIRRLEIIKKKEHFFKSLRIFANFENLIR